jgi:tetratricopeptide (TPR) repeat protein
MCRVRLVAFASTCLTLALATTPASGQSSSGAQLLPGMGTYTHPIRTSSASAQRYFDQGLMLLYNFNHAEAERSFLKAAELDPHAAMPWWGVGVALGLNYNRDVTRLEGDRAKRAYEAAQKAVALSTEGPPAEQALAAALATRYSLDPAADPGVLNHRYREAMRDVHQRFPDDPEAAVMYADALMNLRPWELWDAAGAPAEDTLELVAVLESVLRRWPNHPGANHYYIHAVEASPTPERALPSAERLATLVPGAGHLVHMPTHIYMHTGDYDQVASVNEHAAAVDESYIAAAQPQGVYPFMYYAHNVHFAMMGHVLAGRYAPARAQADKLAGIVRPHIAEMAAMVEWTMTLSALVDVKFHRWEAIQQAPTPPAAWTLATAIDAFARATAYARTGRSADAAAEAARFDEVQSKVPKDTLFGSLNKGSDVLALASAVLKGTLARSPAERAAHLADAVRLQDALRYDEPPPWPGSVREALGAALLEAGRAAEAEAVFREDLRRTPRNGRSLFGLVKCLEAEGRSADAAFVRRELDDAWKGADGPLSLDALW